MTKAPSREDFGAGDFRPYRDFEGFSAIFEVGFDLFDIGFGL